MNNQEKLIYSMLLGDGWLCKKDLRIQHSSAQLDYLKWKRNILKTNNIDSCEIKYKDNNGFPAYYFYTKSYSFIKDFQEKYYVPTKTSCILNNLYYLTPLSIAIWYMDDGGLSQKRRDGKIIANELMLNTGLQKEENQIIIDYFNKIWNISFSQVKNNGCYRLRCGTKEARKFADIVKPYVKQVDSLIYKILIKDYVI